MRPENEEREAGPERGQGRRLRSKKPGAEEAAGGSGKRAAGTERGREDGSGQGYSQEERHGMPGVIMRLDLIAEELRRLRTVRKAEMEERARSREALEKIAEMMARRERRELAREREQMEK